MEISWSNIGQIVLIISTICGAIKYFIINPSEKNAASLEKTFASLEEAIDELKDTMHEMEKNRQSMDIRLARVEESSKSAHHRVDEVVGRVGIIEKQMKGVNL